jgi:hypothetical protein
LKLSMQATMFVSGIVAAICLGVAISGFSSLGEIADPATAADARGFALFWAFLGGVAIVLGVLAWWIARNDKKDEDA